MSKKKRKELEQVLKRPFFSLSDLEQTIRGYLSIYFGNDKTTYDIHKDFISIEVGKNRIVFPLIQFDSTFLVGV